MYREGCVQCRTVYCEGCVLDLEQASVKDVCCDVLLTSDSCRFRSVKAFGRNRGWAVNAAKVPSLKGEPGAYRGFCGSLIKNPAGVELSLWRLSCNFTRTNSGLDLAVEDKVW